MGAGVIRRVSRELGQGAGLWLEALREVGDNPIPYLLRLVADRRAVARRRSWLVFIRSRVIPLVTVALVLAVSYVAMRHLFMDIRNAHGRGSLFNVYTGLMALAAIYLFALMLPVLYRATNGVLGFLSRLQDNRGDTPRLDLFALSGLGDREIVAGLLLRYLPGLALSSLGGAGLMGFVLCIIQIQDAWSSSALARAGASISLLPLTVLSVTLSGILGGVLLVLLLIALGAGSTGRTFITGTSIWLCVQYALYCVFIGPASLWFLDEVLWFWRDDINHLTGFGLALGFAVILVLWFAFALYEAELRRKFGRFILNSQPLVFVISAFVMLTYSGLNHDNHDAYGASFRLAAVYNWGSLLVLNPLAIPYQRCLGVFGVHNDFILGWYHYAVLILCQLGLIAIAANFARRAVGRLRNGYD